MIEKKRIVFLASDIGIKFEQSGGAGTHIRGTILGLQENGFEVLPILGGDVFVKKAVSGSNITSKEKSNFLFLKKIIPLKIIFLYRDLRRIYYDYLIERKTFLKIQKYAPVAIYERSALLSRYGVRLSKKLNIPLFIESDGCMPEIINMDYGIFSIRLSNYFEKIKFTKAEKVVVVNQYSLLFISKKFHIPTEKMIVKTLGIQPLNVTIPEADVEKIKLKFNIQNKKIIGFVGSVSKYHGVDLILECANILSKKRVDNVVFFIVGWSKEASSLKNKAEKLGLNNIIFAGHVDKNLISLYYKMFNAGIIPDVDPYIYPIKVLEYGLFELCPLVPNYEVFNEIIINEVTGLYFIKKDPYSLAETVLKYFSLDYEERLKVISENWHQNVLSNFQWKEAVKNVVVAVNKIN